MAADHTNDPTWDRWEGAAASIPDPLDTFASTTRTSLPPPPPPAAPAASDPAATPPYPVPPYPVAPYATEPAPQPYSPPTSVYNRMGAVPFVAAAAPRRRSPWPYVAVAALLVGGGLVALPRLGGNDAGAVRTASPVSSRHVVESDAVRFALPGKPDVDHDPLEALGMSIPQTVWSYEDDDTTLVVIVQSYPEALDDRTVMGAFDGAVGGMRRDFGDAIPQSDITSTDADGRPTRDVSLTGEGQNVSMMLRAKGNHLVVLLGATRYDKPSDAFMALEKSFSFV